MFLIIFTDENINHIHFTPFLCVLLNYTINAIIIKEKDYALSIIEKP